MEPLRIKATILKKTDSVQEKRAYKMNGKNIYYDFAILEFWNVALL
jgi:hypothetical protein